MYNKTESTRDLNLSLKLSNPKVVQTIKNLCVYLIHGKNIDTLILQELAYQREKSFRAHGMGTGLELDIDACDSHQEHLIIWDTEENRILAGLRFYPLSRGLQDSYLASLFHIDPGVEKTNPAFTEISRLFVSLDAKKYAAIAFSLLFRSIASALTSLEVESNYLVGVASISQQKSPIVMDAIVEFILSRSPPSPYWKNIFTAKTPYLMQGTLNRKHRQELSTIQSFKQLAELLSRWEGNTIQVPELIELYQKLNAAFIHASVDKSFSNCIDILSICSSKPQISTITKGIKLD